MAETVITRASTRRLAKGHKFKKVMGEFGRGTLHSSSGSVVTNAAQAQAIAFSTQRRVKRKRK